MKSRWEKVELEGGGVEYSSFTMGVWQSKDWRWEGGGVECGVYSRCCRCDEVEGGGVLK